MYLNTSQNLGLGKQLPRGQIPFLFVFFFPFSSTYVQETNQMFVFLSVHKFGYIYVTSGNWVEILFHNKVFPEGFELHSIAC